MDTPELQLKYQIEVVKNAAARAQKEADNLFNHVEHLRESLANLEVDRDIRLAQAISLRQLGTELEERLGRQMAIQAMPKA